VPTKDWGAIFKPHNWVFFVLPYDNAFAFKWWFIGYLLLLSCYFFILAQLPGKRLFAALISIAIFFSPFIQWWYLSSTLGSIYYCLFIAMVFMSLLKASSMRKRIVLGGVLGYLLVSFALILYPPFQLACLLAISAFMIGFLLENIKKIDKQVVVKNLGTIIISGILAGIIVLLFLHAHSDAVSAIEKTVYPGKRTVLSGGFDLVHLFSSHLAVQFQDVLKANNYSIPQVGIYNQSESSNFILLIPFLFLPGLWLLWKKYKQQRQIDWPLLTTSLAFILFLIRLYVPHFNWFFKLLLLDKVPNKRLVIGIGLLGVIYSLLFVRQLLSNQKIKINRYAVLIYVVLIFAIEAILGYYAHHRFPGFIGLNKAILLSIPIPVIIYLLISKRFVLAALGLVAFSAFSSAGINPLYRGTAIITQTPLSQEIRKISKSYKDRWVIEPAYLENFAIINGSPSLTGTYAYPQISLWHPIDSGRQQDIYNRYAHVTFNLDRNPNKQVPTQFDYAVTDHFSVLTEPCSVFLRQEGVGLLLTEVPLSKSDECLKLIDKVIYPAKAFYIYKIY
jgi:hypothetical protein